MTKINLMTQQIIVSLPASIIRILERRATEAGASLSGIVAGIIIDHLRKDATP